MPIQPVRVINVAGRPRREITVPGTISADGAFSFARDYSGLA
jgi:hypothetical protein